jgi:hypothetical protein
MKRGVLQGYTLEVTGLTLLSSMSETGDNIRRVPRKFVGCCSLHNDRDELNVESYRQMVRS